MRYSDDVETLRDDAADAEQGPNKAFYTIRTTTAEDSHAMRSVHAKAHGTLRGKLMSFSIWTGLTARRRLGNINRARKDAYIHSSNYRASFDKCPIHEPGVAATPGSAA